MRVQCEECERVYDDAERWTICPHNRLEAHWAGDGRGENGGGYCEHHDLYNCPFHEPAPRPTFYQRVFAWYETRFGKGA